MGVVGAVYCTSSVAGPLLGGVFTDRLSWRWCFYINLPIGAVAAAFILFCFQNPKRAKIEIVSGKQKIIQMDIPGTIVLLAAIICLSLALQWGGQTKPWKSAPVIGTLVGFGLLVAIFIIVERYQGEKALIIPRLIRKKTLAIMCIFQMINMGSGMVSEFFLIY
jgi:MFS family permease